MNSILSNNLAHFRVRFPDLYALHNGAMHHAFTEADQFEVISARNGDPTLCENGVFLHSAYNPTQEAARLIEQIATNSPKSSQNTPKSYIFLGFGLGYLPLALTKAVSATSCPHTGDRGGRPNILPLVLVEPDPARLALAFRHLDWTPILAHPDLALLIGASTQTVIGALNRLIPSLAAVRIFSQPAQTAHAALYFAELSELIRRNIEKQAINQRTLTKYETLWRRNTQRNLYLLTTLPGVDTLPKNSAKSAIIVAAGPTLEALLPKLAALHADKAPAELQECVQRIETLKEAPNLVLDPDAYKGKYELNKESILKYLETLKSETFYNDTLPLVKGKPLEIKLSSRSIRKITDYGMSNPEYMKSLAYIPQLAQQAIFITKQAPKHTKYKSYYHLVAGVAIAEPNSEKKEKKQTIRVVIGEDGGGWYYSHFITDIEKGSLIERIPRPNRGVQTSLPFIKDTTLLEILQEPFVKKEENEASPLIIAVDTALRSLLAAGIDADYVVVADAQYWNARHLAGLAAPHATLVTEIAVPPSVFRFPCVRILLYDSANPVTSELCGGQPAKGALAAGGSVASVAWDLARRLGATDIYLAGLDLAFPRKRTHARGSLFEGQSHQASRRLAPQETAAVSALFSAPTVLAADYAGRPLLTDQRMRLYAWWFESAIAAHPEVRTWSLSDESLAIPGVRVKKGGIPPKE